MSPPAAAAIFFLQVSVILGACWVTGHVMARLGQPRVIGEMLAGVLLGPSCFGAMAPEIQQAIFPPASLGVLGVVAQLAVGLYMFLVGLEFRIDMFRVRARRAMAVAVSGIALPLLLGGAIGLWLTGVPGFFGAEVPKTVAVTFLAAAMAITALPVLARILEERGLSESPLGVLTLAAGGFSDAVAWILLAFVLASMEGDVLRAVPVVLGGALYVVGMLTLGRRVFASWGASVERTGGITPTGLGGVLAAFALAAWGSDAIGLHAALGGFVLGTTMPRGTPVRDLCRQLNPLVKALLLPMFFTFSGLNTRLGLLNDGSLVLVTVVVIGAACLGKGVGCGAAARLIGETSRVAVAVGALMNVRGMMELIFLNIGLQRGIVEPPLFAVMVAMTIATTVVASPVLGRLYRTSPRGIAAEHSAPSAHEPASVLDHLASRPSIALQPSSPVVRFDG